MHNDEQAAFTAKGLHGTHLSQAPNCMSVRAASYSQIPGMVRSYIDDTKQGLLNQEVTGSNCTPTHSVAAYAAVSCRQPNT